jgi:MFS family permease
VPPLARHRKVTQSRIGAMDATPSTTTTARGTPAVLLYRRANLGDRPDDCYRCGYPLLGIEDEQPCPECGLLARRSRRETDELHNTRPRWLKRISRGANLILLAILVAIAWAILWNITRWRAFRVGSWWFVQLYVLPIAGYVIAATILIVGAWLLASREQYPPADQADRRLRMLLRTWAFVPLVGLLIVIASGWLITQGRVTPYSHPITWEIMRATILVFLTAGLAPLPLLVFMRLRGLATRVRSAHLAEHCSIVGYGTSAAFLWAGLLALLAANADRWGFGTWWMERSSVALAIMLIMAVALILFTLWSLYLFTRFAIAFGHAARQLRGKWTSDDRALTPHGSAAAPPA